MIDSINFSIEPMGDKSQDPRGGSWRSSSRLSIYRKNIEAEKVLNPGKKPEGYDDLIHRHLNN